MWMTEYIHEIQKKLVSQYGFLPDAKGLPLHVPDSNYPMEIDGKLDRVRITDNRISCCNYDGEKS